MSTLILTFQFSSCRFFRQQNPEQGGAKKITEPGSEQKPEQDLRSLDPGAEEQPNPEVARHQNGINALRAELDASRAELDALRAELDALRAIVNNTSSEKERQGFLKFLNRPVTFGSLARMYFIYLISEPVIDSVIRKIMKALGL